MSRGSECGGGGGGGGSGRGSVAKGARRTGQAALIRPAIVLGRLNSVTRACAWAGRRVRSRGVELLPWLRARCAEFAFDAAGVFRRSGDHEWPLRAENEDDLERQLADGGHLMPLPTEPAALANQLEIGIVAHVLREVDRLEGAEAQRGTERGYPDIEIVGPAFGPGPYAVDVKVARLAPNGRRTQSRITLYTGNTYFRYPQLHWPNTLRAFQDYVQHLDIIALYRFDPNYRARVRNLELIVHEPWRIASRRRSSTTREYIGAVQSVEALREGQGEFETEEEFYRYWRAYRFRITPAVQQQLDKLLAEYQEGDQTDYEE